MGTPSREAEQLSPPLSAGEGASEGTNPPFSLSSAQGRTRAHPH